MKKFISILGSTGSIGLNTLSIIDKKKGYFKPFLFAANKNYKKICQQIKKYKPNYFIIRNKKIYLKVKQKFKKNKNIKILHNYDFKELKKKKIDITVTAIQGIEGLNPTILAIRTSKKVLLANKESVICGWNILKKNITKYKTKVIPIDSEHFSILKLLRIIDFEDIDKIFITASGGPFLNYKIKEFKKITPKDALKHPKWKMGKKISIDSATLMNKIFEVIEAQKIFNIDPKKIEILIHPESLIHAIIKLKNGLNYFIYHNTSMVIPLANAIFEKKLEIKKIIKFSTTKNKNNFNNLSFKTVDSKIFPSISLIQEINKYYSAAIIINAANEILVDQFLRKNIDFMSIFKIIKTILNDRNYKKYAIRKPQSINQITNIDKWARNITLEKIKK
ncbi:MAG: 1-deoxy-D-xylulose-5-phosphate reductoisomerase [Alphaproteobacteria bacterium]